MTTKTTGNCETPGCESTYTSYFSSPPYCTVCRDARGIASQAAYTKRVQAMRAIPVCGPDSFMAKCIALMVSWEGDCTNLNEDS